MKAIERRLRELEEKSGANLMPRVVYLWSDDEDPEPKRLAAEAELRAYHGIPDNVELQSMGIHLVSVGWMKPQEAA